LRRHPCPASSSTTRLTPCASCGGRTSEGGQTDLGYREDWRELNEKLVYFSLNSLQSSRNPFITNSTLTGPQDDCDHCNRCGHSGVCNQTAASTAWTCSCVQGFVPVSSSDWDGRDPSGGCRRNVSLDCGDNGTTERADVQGGGDDVGTGCIMWPENLTDLRYVAGGQTLYLRQPTRPSIDDQKARDP
jgi:hypothetical protein